MAESRVKSLQNAWFSVSDRGSIQQGNPMPDELSNDVARHFEREWQNYDQQIRRTIPFYDDALELLVAVVARTDTTPHRILDLGVGTGNLAGLLLGAFPDAHLTGIDIVPDFLEIAQHRLARFRDRSNSSRQTSQAMTSRPAST
jgi:methylase of polypeptide subunit release factors